MTLRPFAEHLHAAETLPEIARIVAHEVWSLADAGCLIALFASAGAPVILDGRGEALAGVDLERDPVLTRVRASGRVEDDGPPRPEVIAAPIFGDLDVIGAIRCRAPGGLPPTFALDLAAICTHVSVRMVRLGLLLDPARPAGAPLTPRQRDVVELLARGYTNHEIGRALQISTNAVKNHLKQVFARLGVANRTECVSRLSRRAPSRAA